MWNALFMGIVAVCAGACITWLIGDSLSERVAAHSEDAGRFAGLGATPPRDTAPARRGRLSTIAAQRRYACAARRRRVAQHVQRSPLH